MGKDTKTNGWPMVRYLLGAILASLLAFAGWSANGVTVNADNLINHQLKPSHVGTDARVKAIEDDVREIKQDVKELLRR